MHPAFLQKFAQEEILVGKMSEFSFHGRDITRNLLKFLLPFGSRYLIESVQVFRFLPFGLGQLSQLLKFSLGCIKCFIILCLTKRIIQIISFGDNFCSFNLVKEIYKYIKILFLDYNKS